MPTSSERSDHDILIRVETNLDNLTKEVIMMRDGTKEQITRLFSEKLDKKLFEATADDHERRLRRLERYMWGAVAILAFINFILLAITALK